MTIIRDTLTSPSNTCRQNQASTSTPRQSSPPARTASPARSRPPSPADTFSKEGDQVSGSRSFGEYKSNRLTDEQRQELLDIFINRPTELGIEIARQFRVSPSTISRLQRQFSKTGNIYPRNPGKRLTEEQRQKLLHAFTNPNLNDTEIAQQFLVSNTTISKLRRQLIETGNINRREPTNRLPHEKKQQIGHVASSSKTASGKSSKRPASTSADLEHLHLQKRARIDSAPLYAGQTSDQTSSTGIRIFGVQLYPEKAAQHGQQNN
jgi:transposase